MVKFQQNDAAVDSFLTTARQSKFIHNTSKHVESAFSFQHRLVGKLNSEESRALKRPRFEIKHGLALSKSDLDDALEEVYDLEVIMVSE